MSTATASHDVSMYQKQVEEAAAYLREHLPAVPSCAMVLGTGLGSMADELTELHTISYEEIPHAPVATTAAHAGRLLLGTFRGTSVLALQGRLHAYEGYSPWECTFLIRVLGVLGVQHLLVSNAAGGMDPHYEAGDLMLVTDHLNLQYQNPLVGPNVDDWGPRFPDMSEPYDLELRAKAEQAALRRGLRLHQGVYVAVTGPNLETRAEYRFLRALGGDAVGMSTVPEVIVARHMGLRVLAISVITDECLPDALQPVSIEDVVQAAREARPHLVALFGDIIADVSANA